MKQVNASEMVGRLKACWRTACKKFGTLPASVRAGVYIRRLCRFVSELAVLLKYFADTTPGT